MNIEMVNQKLAEIHALIGPRVIRQVELEEEIPVLKEKLHACADDNLADYRTAITEKGEELLRVKSALRLLHMNEREALMDKYQLLDMQIQNHTANAVDEDELRIVQQDIMKRIHILNALI